MDTPGIKLRISGERVVFFSRGRVKELPLRELEEIRIMRGVSLTSDLLVETSSRGIITTLVDERGKPVAIVIPSTYGGTVRTRREQILAYYDERSAEIAKVLVKSSLRSRSWLLRRLYRSRPEAEPIKEAASEIEKLENEISRIKGERVDLVRTEIMNVEGRASALYFSALSNVIDERYFRGVRTRRPPRDEFNAALSYANSMIYSESLKKVIFSGLDPYAGFLHVDRSGRFSLALDLAEEFIVPASHRPVISLFTRRMMKKDDFERTGSGIYLSPEGKSKVRRAIMKAISEDRIEHGGKSWRIGDLMLIRARELVSFIRGSGRFDPMRYGR